VDSVSIQFSNTLDDGTRVPVNQSKLSPSLVAGSIVSNIVPTEAQQSVLSNSTPTPMIQAPGHPKALFHLAAGPLPVASLATVNNYLFQMVQQFYQQDPKLSDLLTLSGDNHSNFLLAMSALEQLGNLEAPGYQPKTFLDPVLRYIPISDHQTVHQLYQEKVKEDYSNDFLMHQPTITHFSKHNLSLEKCLIVGATMSRTDYAITANNTLVAIKGSGHPWHTRLKFYRNKTKPPLIWRQPFGKTKALPWLTEKEIHTIDHQLQLFGQGTDFSKKLSQHGVFLIPDTAGHIHSIDGKAKGGYVERKMPNKLLMPLATVHRLVSLSDRDIGTKKGRNYISEIKTAFGQGEKLRKNLEGIYHKIGVFEAYLLKEYGLVGLYLHGQNILVNIPQGDEPPDVYIRDLTDLRSILKSKDVSAELMPALASFRQIDDWNKININVGRRGCRGISLNAGIQKPFRLSEYSRSKSYVKTLSELMVKLGSHNAYAQEKQIGSMTVPNPKWVQSVMAS